jgi:hypothetical protein
MPKLVHELLTAAVTATASYYGELWQSGLEPSRRAWTYTDSMPAPFNPRVVGSSPTGPTTV